MEFYCTGKEFDEEVEGACCIGLSSLQFWDIVCRD
jgi:hypothetical protein